MVMCQWNVVSVGIEEFKLFEVRILPLQLRTKLGPPRKIGVVTSDPTNRAAFPLTSWHAIVARPSRLSRLTLPTASPAASDAKSSGKTVSPDPPPHPLQSS
jgi:hypothetical protein